MSGSRRRRPSLAWNLDRLRWVAVVLPVAFILAIEALRHLSIPDDAAQQQGHLALAGMMLAGAVVFALVMFIGIEATQKQLVRQNRELAAVNAVSTAIQGELGLDVVIDAALESVMASTGATEGVVRVFAPHGARVEEAGFERHRVASPHASPLASTGQTVPHLIDVPLSTGTSIVGRMQLHLPEGAEEPDLLATATLNNIGHQLASAIQIRQLVLGLQQRQDEDHRLYDILLRVSNQAQLAQTLAAVVRDARELLRADEAAMCLNEAGTRAIQDDDPQGGLQTPNATATCIHDETVTRSRSGENPPTCELRKTIIEGPIIETQLRGPDGLGFGTLWLGRHDGPAFSERDERFLEALSDLASIAISSARGRESERQGAIVAERERIAREMHDSLAQVLGVTHLRLRALGVRDEVVGAATVAAEIADLATLAEEAYRDVREAILGLREATRLGRSFMDGLAAYLEKFSHQSGIATHLESTVEGELDLPPRVEVQLIRVIQEALTNVRKHGAASEAVVRLGDDPEGIEIVIEDDGRGFDVGGTLLGRDGFGLHTMRERVALIGGTLSIDSAPGRGTRVVAVVPSGHPVLVAR